MNKETLQNYNERLNANNTSLDNAIQLINNLPEVSGTIEITTNGKVDVTAYKTANVNVEGGGSGAIKRPFYINDSTFIYETTGTSYNRSIPVPKEVDGKPNLILVFWFARSKCNIYGDVTVIHQSTEVISETGTTQTLYIGYINYTTTPPNITITQETSGRMGLGYLLLGDCDIPEVVQESPNDIPAGKTLLSKDNYFNVVVVSQISGTGTTTSSNLPSTNGVRLNMYMFNGIDEEDYVSFTEGRDPKFVQIRLPYKKV